MYYLIFLLFTDREQKYPPVKYLAEKDRKRILVSLLFGFGFLFKVALTFFHFVKGQYCWDFINVFSKRTTGFQRQANFFIRITFL